MPALAADAQISHYETRYLEAMLLQSARRYDEAIERLEPYRSGSDTPPEMLLALAQNYFSATNRAEGRKVLDETIKKYPEFVPARVERSRDYRREGKNGDAVEDLEAALEIVPDNKRILEEIGLLRLRTIRDWNYTEGEDSDVARLIGDYTHLLELLRGRRKVRPLIVLSSVYTRVGDHDRAIAASREASELSVRDLRTHMSLAEAYEAAKRLPEALGAYRQALLLQPMNPTLQNKVRRLIAAEGQEGSVLSFYEEMAKSFPLVKEIQELYGNELIKATDWEAVLKHFTTMNELWPADGRVKMFLVLSLILTGEEERGMAMIVEFLEDDERELDQVLQIAEVLRRAGKAEAVIEMLVRVGKSRPGDYRPQFLMARVQNELGRKADAIATLEEVVRRRPDVFLAAAMLGELYAEDGQFDKAHEIYDRVEEATRPRHTSDITYRKADLLKREGKTAAAIELLETFLAQSGDNATGQAVRLLVEMQTGQDDYEGARATLQAHGSKLTGSEFIKAWLYWRARDYESAIARLEDLHGKDPRSYDYVELLADAYAKSDEFDKAHSLLAQAETTMDERFLSRILLLRAQTYKDENKTEQALEIMDRLIESNPEEDQYYLMAGEFYYEAGQMDQAERLLRRAIELSPESSEPYNALGYFFAEAGVRLDEALVLVERALELNPEAWHITDSLGWVYYQQGKYEKAVEILSDAVARMGQGTDPVVYEHLGDAYIKLGEGERAREIWSKALDLNPDADSIRVKLDSQQD